VAAIMRDVAGFKLSDRLSDSANEIFIDALMASGCSTIDEFVAYLRSDLGRRAARALVGELTVKETYFFRTPEHFDALSAGLQGFESGGRVPLLDIPKGVPVRIWSAGCATGEEPYSIGMTVLGALGKQDAQRAYILASDISTGAIDAARRGTYDRVRTPPSIGADREHLIARYLPVDENGLHKVAPALRRLVHFMPHDIMKDAPPLGQDVVFCRNVMIYLSREDQTKLVDRLWSAIKPGGLLFLGDAELLHVMEHRFETVDASGAVAYRKPWKWAA
jgi:chemotaxis methyl-accepting protein methylase